MAGTTAPTTPITATMIVTRAEEAEATQDYSTITSLPYDTLVKYLCLLVC